MKRDPIECSIYCKFYMFCIGLMMAELRPKHVALMWIDIAYIFINVLIYSCVLDGNISTYLPIHNGMASVKKKKLGFENFVPQRMSIMLNA